MKAKCFFKNPCYKSLLFQFLILPLGCYCGGLDLSCLNTSSFCQRVSIVGTLSLCILAAPLMF